MFTGVLATWKGWLTRLDTRVNTLFNKLPVNVVFNKLPVTVMHILVINDFLLSLSLNTKQTNRMITGALATCTCWPSMILYWVWVWAWSKQIVLSSLGLRRHVSKADCVWVGRRRLRPKEKPRFDNCVFGVAQTWTGFSPRLENFAANSKAISFKYSQSALQSALNILNQLLNIRSQLYNQLLNILNQLYYQL
jgi:hypothetical protein